MSYLNVTKISLAALCALVVSAAALGCGMPSAVERSQRLQLTAMVQYRDQMASYHEKMKALLMAEKRSQLDTALSASLAQSADGEGRVALSTIAEKVAKRLALEDDFRASLARLDGEFDQRQAAVGRAIDLANDTLDLLADYNRLSASLRNLFVRETKAEEIINAYETERSVSSESSK